MNKYLISHGMIFLMCLPLIGRTQQIVSDTLNSGLVIVEKDARFDKLTDKLTEYNEGLAKKARLENGYRLMLLSTTDRGKVTELRSRLLQLYPDQRVYTVFQTPYIKVKFGNFLEREEAEFMKEEISALGLVSGNIYIIPEKVEVKGVKENEVKEN